ncbi:MAG: hypothetical protein AAF264_13090 [Pseudomonadota bacterium]
MFENVTTDIHEKRASRNIGTGLCLGAFIILLAVLSAVKVSELGASESERFDHAPRPQLVPAEDG